MDASKKMAKAKKNDSRSFACHFSGVSLAARSGPGRWVYQVGFIVLQVENVLFYRSCDEFVNDGRLFDGLPFPDRLGDSNLLNRCPGFWFDTHNASVWQCYVTGCHSCVPTNERAFSISTFSNVVFHFVTSYNSPHG